MGLQMTNLLLNIRTTCTILLCHKIHGFCYRFYPVPSQEYPIPIDNRKILYLTVTEHSTYYIDLYPLLCHVAFHTRHLK